MTELIKKKINDSAAARWSVVLLVSFTMMSGYFLTDVMAPLKTMLEQTLGWDSQEYGFFTSGYGWLNIFAFMLIVSGIVLDKFGIRFTGTTATCVMIVGTSIKYWAISTTFENPVIDIFGWELNRQVLFAACGYAIFGVGVEAIGITASKIIVKWFKGKELALALGMNVAFGRIGTLLALAVSPIIAEKMGHPSKPILLCLVLLCIGLLSFVVFCASDRKLDKQLGDEAKVDKEDFRIRDILDIVKIKAFWYIAFLCLTFYSAVFPFLKYATELMVIKFHLDPSIAGLIPSILPMGTLFLTPLFGSIYDRKGKGATIMIIGSCMLIVVHALFAVSFFNWWVIAAILMCTLGIAFSLVPSAMWPSVAKIIDQKKLGTAYALIFYVQNWGLSGVPLLIGYVLKKYCITGTTMINSVETTTYDYTLPMLIFMSFGVIGLLFALLLKREDKIKGYGLQLPNIKKSL
ncbi:MAG: MFS transporter [Rikenellaceae bacterium]